MKKYKARPFNAFLLAGSENKISIEDDPNEKDCLLKFEPSAVKFNLKNGFNFNKLFKVGVPFR